MILALAVHPMELISSQCREYPFVSRAEWPKPLLIGAERLSHLNDKSGISVEEPPDKTQQSKQGRGYPFVSRSECRPPLLRNKWCRRTSPSVGKTSRAQLTVLFETMVGTHISIRSNPIPNPKTNQIQSNLPTWGQSAPFVS